LLKRFNGAGKPMKKQPLIILGVILVIVILALAFYAYQKTQITIPISQTPPPLTESTQETKTIDEEKDERKLELEKIKKSIQVSEEKTLKPEDCSEEESKEYQEKVKTGEVKTVQGVVLEVNESSLKVNLSLGEDSWDSNVAVNSDTVMRIPASTNNPAPKDINLKDFEVNDNILVNASNNIENNSNLTAISIFKIN
jgi:predicted RND superfamily exporter protein